VENLETLGMPARRTPAKWTRDHWLALSISIGTVILIVIAYFAWLQPQWKAHADQDLAQQINNQVESKLQDHHFDEMAGDVKIMKGQMTEISGFMKVLVEAELKRVAELPPNEFKNSLPGVRAALAVAKKTPIDLSIDTIEEMRAKLNTTPSGTTGYWQTAAAVISYRGESAPSLPPCRMDQTQPPAVLDGAINAKQTTIKFKIVPYENCVVVLDSKEAQARFLSVLGVFDIEFRHCRIIYGGGPILLPTAAAPGRKKLSIIFTDCFFDISTPGIPSTDAQQLLTSLLSSKDPKAAKVTIS